MELVEAMQGFIVFAMGFAIVVGVWFGIKKLITDVMKESRFEAYVEKHMDRIAAMFLKGK